MSTMNAYCVPSGKGVSLTKLQKCHNKEGSLQCFQWLAEEEVASGLEPQPLFLHGSVALKESPKLSEFSVYDHLAQCLSHSAASVLSSMFIHSTSVYCTPAVYLPLGKVLRTLRSVKTLRKILALPTYLGSLFC